MLVIAAAAVDGEALRGEVQRRAAGREAEVRVVTPAVIDSKLKHTLGDVDEAIPMAEDRLSRAVEGLEGNGIPASAVVGDSDPLIATEDALGVFPADEILVVTHRDDEAKWFEEGLFDRAAERFEPPIVHVELEDRDGRELEEVETSGRGVPHEGRDANEIELSPNLPPFSVRDLVSVAVAILGTLILALLATTVGQSPNGGGAGRISAHTFSDESRILIALAFALINLAHVVGLLLFNAQRYRGPGRELFSRLSLYGTPIAVAVSGLITILS
jgi:hypothetical protein